MNINNKITVLSKIAMGVLCYIILLIGCIRNCTYFEIDSYVLPLISMEYRGSLICTQEDIEKAREDFPSLYRDVYEYEDLRSSKLVKIDDEHWLPYYFPVYAVICLPMKLLLQLLNLDQTKCFSITASILLILLIYLISKLHPDKSSIENLFLDIILLACPIWVYLQLIGIESIAFSVNAIAILLWRKKHYRIAALLVSIICMANPTIMAIGIVLFMDYILEECIEDKRLILKKKIKDIIILAACYIPSLIPFIFNYIMLGRLNLTVSAEMLSNKEETMFHRTLSYLYDLNLGVASFALVMIGVFTVVGLYSVIKRQRRLFMGWLAGILTVFLYSYMIHINCSMILCARYVIWTWPIIAFCVYDFVYTAFRRMITRYIILIALIVLNCGQMIYNGSYGSYELSRTSRFVLNRFPKAYISFCDSTFNARVNHIDGGYYPQDYTIYSDSRNGEIRKIMYRGNMVTVSNLMYVLSLDNDDLSLIENELISSDNKIHYITIGPREEQQYKLGELYHYYEYISSHMVEEDMEQEEALELAEGFQQKDYDLIYQYLNDDAMSDEQYIHECYVFILGRNEREAEMDDWIQKMDQEGMTREDLIRLFVGSQEFINKVGAE